MLKGRDQVSHAEHALKDKFDHILLGGEGMGTYVLPEESAYILFALRALLLQFPVVVIMHMIRAAGVLQITLRGVDNLLMIS